MTIIQTTPIPLPDNKINQSVAQNEEPQQAFTNVVPLSRKHQNNPHHNIQKRISEDPQLFVRNAIPSRDRRRSVGQPQEEENPFSQYWGPHPDTSNVARYAHYGRRFAAEFGREMRMVKRRDAESMMDL
ncbi:UNVERIFIED_CONTAM: hypothetical protein HDU68_008381 [Siphonaria sp. JEL0065]|nr:hypothetical protein HDU68_008381 [Siphonaria sp. JEL0065]